MSLKIALVANSPVSPQSMGGGDRILVELARIWQEMGAQLVLFGPPEAWAICEEAGLNVSFVQTSNFNISRLGTVKTYLFRILTAIYSRQKFGDFQVIYSASESLPDILLSAKVREQNPRADWVVGFYLKAPNPFVGEIILNLNNFLQYIQQLLSLQLMKHFNSSAVLILGKADEKYLRSWGIKKTHRIGGGVDLNLVNSIVNQAKIYDACFVGRISPQKGVDDLLKIWRGVVHKIPSARLAFIGWGHPGQKEKFTEEIKNVGLEKNIDFLGFRDGEAKYKIMKASKLLLFPSKYESFGIVVLEALAAGVPVVAYDLEVLRENFDDAVFYVSLGQSEGFTQKVLILLDDSVQRESLVEAGRRLAARFDWRQLGSDTFNYIAGLGKKT